MKKILFTAMLFALTAQANFLDESVKKYKWNGIDVVWLEDNSLPTYDVLVYFNEGSLTEDKKIKGVGELMFNQLTTGTTRYTQKEILDSLEFYGTNYGSYMTHEYSLFQVSGLVKDYIPSMKMICHVFNDATFPKKELKKVKNRIMSGIQNIVTKHGELASHVFRYESLKGSGYEIPVSGKLKTLKRIKPKDLSQRLASYNKDIQKRIYIKGPKSILGLKNIFENDCAWKQGTRKASYPKVLTIAKSKKVIFVDVGKSNQAQVRIGRVIPTPEVLQNKRELKSFAAKFMGGGFTSQLVQGLRVDRGLTYSAGAYASEQLMYGRAGISTFTKNETIIPMMNAIKSIIQDSASGVKKEKFEMAKRSIKGNYLLGLESTSEFLRTLMFYDHANIPYKEIYQFSNKIDNMNKVEFQAMIDELFGWEKQTIVILGHKSVAKELSKNGFEVKKVNYKDYL